MFLLPNLGIKVKEFLGSVLKLVDLRGLRLPYINFCQLVVLYHTPRRMPTPSSRSRASNSNYIMSQMDTTLA